MFLECSPLVLALPFKVCNRCWEVKPRSEFSIARDSKDGLQYRCRQCNAEYYAENKEHRKELRIKNAERTRAYRKANADYFHEYYLANAPQKRLRNRERYAASPEKKRESSRKWNIANPEKVRARSQRRRARQRNAPGRGVTGADIKALIVGQTDKRGRVHCWWCGVVIHDGKWHVDHRIALAIGGAHDPGNLCLSCPDCNTRKQSKTPGDFAGRLL
jgi:5-methylcytosine-specific restriction endonuclease McrA